MERRDDATAARDQRPLEPLGDGDGCGQAGDGDEHQGFKCFARKAKTRSSESFASGLSPYA